MRIEFNARLATLFGLALLAPTMCFGADWQCASLIGGGAECVSVVYGPAGRLSIKERRKAYSAEPYFREISGAISGLVLFGDVRLIFDTSKKTWIARYPDDRSIDLFSYGESVPKVVANLEGAASRWDITVTMATMPVEVKGIATEDVPKISLQLVRK